MLRNSQDTSHIDVLSDTAKINHLTTQIEIHRRALLQQIKHEPLEIALELLAVSISDFENRKYKDYLDNKTDRANRVLAGFDLFSSLLSSMNLNENARATELLKVLDEYTDAVEAFHNTITNDLEKQITNITTDEQSNSAEAKPDYSGYNLYWDMDGIGDLDFHTTTPTLDMPWQNNQLWEMEAEPAGSSTEIISDPPMSFYSDDLFVTEEDWAEEEVSYQRASLRSAFGLFSHPYDAKTENSNSSEDKYSPLPTRPGYNSSSE